LSVRDLVGAVFADRYRVVARIAGGGMGEVYRGHDLLLDRAVAIKVLQRSLADDPDLVDRFRQEARAAARLVHSNVVAVYDWGAHDDRTYFMVMEYVAGTDLRDVLVARGALEPAHAVEIMASVCDALAEAHDKGLVHRDVKPENVLISTAGLVKVADFGIAAVADSDRTNPGIVPGTLRYLSPEQARGERATAASDMWAAGAVLSECLTGRPPSQGSGSDILRRRAEDEPVPPSRFNSSIHPDLDAIVIHACALDPADRWPRISLMAAELRKVDARSSATAPPVASLVEDETDYTQIAELEPTTRAGRAADNRRARRRKRRPLGRLVVACVLAAGALFGGRLVVSAIAGPNMVAVPSLLKLSRAEVVNKLEELGLVADFDKRKDKFEAKGEVLDQRPLAGEVLEEGLAVNVTISSGPPLVKLPSLIGMTEAEARAILLDDELGLQLGTVTKVFSLDERGTIISYRPAENRIAWGSSVELTISKGPEPLEVPDVVGFESAKAVKRLEDVGFKVTQLDYYSDDVPIGEVIATSPGASEIALTGSEIQVQVSIGPEFEKLKLPDVRNLTIDQARAELESLGLRVKVVQSCGGGGSTVTETDPVSGTTVQEDDLIALFVC
jgi:eukaryotic-like serine/threonine-protein kinase